MKRRNAFFVSDQPQVGDSAVPLIGTIAAFVIPGLIGLATGLI